MSASPQDFVKQSEKDQALQEIFASLKTNNMQLDQDSTLVLLDVDDTLAYLGNNGGGYNDFLIKKLRDLAKDPNVKFCLFTNMSLEDIKNDDAADEKRTKVLLRLKEYGIGIERVVMPGDLGHKHPMAADLLQEQISKLEEEIIELMKKMVPPAFSEEQKSQIEQELMLFAKLTDFPNKSELLKKLLKILDEMYRYIDSQNGKKIAIEIGNITKEFLIRIDALQRKENKSHRQSSYIAGSSFVEHYIPAFESSNNYEQCKSDNDCLAKLDREISQKILALDEEENSWEARHSKARLLDALLDDPKTGIPGKIIFFDDRAECISSVDKRTKQINEFRLNQGQYPICFVGLQLKDQGKDNALNRAAINAVVENHLVDKRVPFRENNLSPQEKKEILDKIVLELNKRNVFIFYNKQVVPDLIDLAKTGDVTALYLLAQIAAEGKFGLPKDPVSAYYLAKLAICFATNIDGKNKIREFIINLEQNFPHLKNGEAISHQKFPQINGLLPSELYQRYLVILEVGSKKMQSADSLSEEEPVAMLVTKADEGDIPARLQLAHIAMMGLMGFGKSLDAAQSHLEQAFDSWAALPDDDKKMHYAAMMQVLTKELDAEKRKEKSEELDVEKSAEQGQDDIRNRPLPSSLSAAPAVTLFKPEGQAEGQAQVQAAKRASRGPS